MTPKAGQDRPHVLVLAGGGIDSTLCIYQLTREGRRVRALHIDYGQLASDREWESVERTANTLDLEASHITLRPAPLLDGPKVVGRNAALICIALLYARPTEGLICAGVHSGTPFFDCSPSFIDTLGRLVAEQTDSRVRLIAPLLSLSKPAIVARARTLEVPISYTYSCQSGTVPPCGSCHSCKDRVALGC